MSAPSSTKTSQAGKADTVPPEAPAQARPKLSLHYGAKTVEERK